VLGLAARNVISGAAFGGSELDRGPAAPCFGDPRCGTVGIAPAVSLAIIMFAAAANMASVIGIASRDLVRLCLSTRGLVRLCLSTRGSV